MINIHFKNGKSLPLPDDLQDQFLNVFLKNNIFMFATFYRQGKIVLCINLHEIQHWEVYERPVIKPFPNLPNDPSISGLN